MSEAEGTDTPPLSDPRSRSGRLVPDQLFRVSLGDQIAATLRDEIVHGVIGPGTHLVQAELCERFGTSRMPVRDALQQLEHDGLLVERFGQREVVSLDEAGLLDAYHLIAVLHGWAARLVTETASDESLGELDAAFTRAMEASTGSDHTQLAWLWHRQINLLAGSLPLFRAIATIQATVPLVYPSLVRDSQTEFSKHALISMMDAIRARNADEAERLVRFHSIEAAQWLLDSLSSPNDRI